MSLPRKAKFAKYLMDHPDCTAADVMRVSQRDNLGIQVKTLSAKGDFVIKFDERGSFIKPNEWLNNYLLSTKQRYNEICSLNRYLQGEEENVEQVTETDNALKEFAEKYSDFDAFLKDYGLEPDGPSLKVVNSYRAREKVKASKDTSDKSDTVKFYRLVSRLILPWYNSDVLERSSVDFYSIFDQINPVKVPK